MSKNTITPQKPVWEKCPPQIKGAVNTYRKGVGSCAIHEYGKGEKQFHFNFLGVSESFNNLSEAKKYGNGFVITQYNS
jgi:hypothetical protein